MDRRTASKLFQSTHNTSHFFFPPKYPGTRRREKIHENADENIFQKKAKSVGARLLKSSADVSHL